MATKRRAIVGAIIAAGVAVFGGAVSAKAEVPVLTVASFGGAIDATVRKAMSGFEEKFGVQVKYVPGTSSENAAKVIASKGHPELDIVMLDDVTYEAASSAGVLAKFDPKIVTNLANLRPQARFPNMDGLPIGFNFTGIFYNNVEFEKRGWAAPRTWDDLFRPEFCHHIGFPDTGVSYFFNMTAMLAGGDVSKMQDGINKFLKLKGCFATLEPSSAKLEEKIQLGEYLIGVHGLVRVMPLGRAGVPVRFVIPDGPTPLTSTTASPVLNSPNEKLAQEFCNWIISVQAQKILMQEALYIPVTTNVEVPEELQKIGMPNPDILNRAINLDRAAITAQRRNWARQVERGLAP